MNITLEPLTQERLGDFRSLLGSSEFGGCFCAVWTSFDETWVKRCEDKAQPNFLITQRDVEEGRHVGYLVYQGDELVAWTGSGPKTSFPFLKTKLGSRLSDFSSETWSVGCLAVRQTCRGKGLADLIVKAVADEASRQGANVLEAYPTRPFHEPRVFRGTETLYKRLGFTEVTAEKDGAHEILLLRLDLRNRP